MLHSRMLKFLDEVERAGSIRRASTRLNVASSSINRQIIALEQEIGMPLFERLNNRLRLTESGALVIAHVRQTLQQHEQVQARIEDLKRKRRSEVTVATTSGLAAGLLPRVVAGFRARHPDIKAAVRILPMGQIVASLASGESDLAVATGLSDDLDVDIFTSVVSQIGAVMRPGHALMGQPSIALSDCQTLPLILADIGMPLRLVLDDACMEAGLTLEPVIESNSLEMMKRSAMLGLGITFLHYLEVEDEVRRGDLGFVPLIDPHVQLPVLRVVYRPGSELDALPRELAEEIAMAIEPAEGDA
jgi:DNA-binding transcriptional LysR family regulator